MAIHTPGPYFQKPGIWTRIFWQHAQVHGHDFWQDHVGKSSLFSRGYYQKEYLGIVYHITEVTREIFVVKYDISVNYNLLSVTGKLCVVTAGVHKIFFVWYPTFFSKNLPYEIRDCYYQKMRQKSRYKMEYIT